MDQWDMTLVPVRCPESWRMKLLGCVSELSKDLLESLCLFDILTPKFWHRFGATSSCQVGHNPSMQRLVLRPTSSRQTAKVSWVPSKLFSTRSSKAEPCYYRRGRRDVVRNVVWGLSFVFWRGNYSSGDSQIIIASWKKCSFTIYQHLVFGIQVVIVALRPDQATHYFRSCQEDGPIDPQPQDEVIYAVRSVFQVHNLGNLDLKFCRICVSVCFLKDFQYFLHYHYLTFFRSSNTRSGEVAQSLADVIQLQREFLQLKSFEVGTREITKNSINLMHL